MVFNGFTNYNSSQFFYLFTNFSFAHMLIDFAFIIPHIHVLSYFHYSYLTICYPTESTTIYPPPK